MKDTVIALGSDDLGHELKELLRAHLTELGHRTRDFGVRTAEEGDYPDVARAVAESIRAGECESAILVCGTGAGMAIAANKVPGVRAVCVTDPYTAERARASNDAQIITMGSRITTPTLALRLLDIWLAAEFQTRSAGKVAKIAEIERSYRESA